MVRSDTASRLGIDNTPTPEAFAALEALCIVLLEPIRENFGRSVRVSSGYRCDALNRAIGGKPYSQHKKGEAVDFEVDGVDNLTAAKWVSTCVPTFDQLILEHYTSGDPESGWIHLSYRADGRNRREVLTVERIAGTVKESKGLPR